MKTNQYFDAFALQVIGVTVLSYLLTMAILPTYFPQFYHVSLWIVPLFVSGTTYLLHWRLTKTIQKKPKQFVTVFMAVTGIKLMLYLFAILIYVLIFTAYAVPFMAIFFTLYVIFTALEINSLLLLLKQNP